MSNTDIVQGSPEWASTAKGVTALLPADADCTRNTLRRAPVCPLGCAASSGSVLPSGARRDPPLQTSDPTSSLLRLQGSLEGQSDKKSCVPSQACPSPLRSEASFYPCPHVLGHSKEPLQSPVGCHFRGQELRSLRWARHESPWQ